MHLIQLLSKHRRSESERYNPHLFHHRAEKRPQGWRGEEGGGIVMPPITFQPFSLHPHPTTLNLILSLSDMKCTFRGHCCHLASTISTSCRVRGEKRTAGQRLERGMIDNWKMRTQSLSCTQFILCHTQGKPASCCSSIGNDEWTWICSGLYIEKLAQQNSFVNWWLIFGESWASKRSNWNCVSLNEEAGWEFFLFKRAQLIQFLCLSPSPQPREWKNNLSAFRSRLYASLF